MQQCGMQADKSQETADYLSKASLWLLAWPFTLKHWVYILNVKTYNCLTLFQSTCNTLKCSETIPISHTVVSEGRIIQSTLFISFDDGFLRCSDLSVQ